MHRNKKCGSGIKLMALCASAAAASCATAPMTLDQQKVYFKSRIVAWQVRAATMCLAREQRDINKPPAEANAAWRAYGNIVFPRYNSELADNLQSWTTDMAVVQRDMDPRQARELDRACAITPGVEQ